MQQLKTVRRRSARTKLLNLKVTAWEEERIKGLADKYAAGNKSEWIRFAALNYEPKKRDLCDVMPEKPTADELEKADEELDEAVEEAGQAYYEQDEVQASQ